MTTTRWETVHVFACAMLFFGVIGLAGIYARQAMRSGWFELVGYVLLALWMVLIMGFSFVEAFILPHLANISPAFTRAWMGTFNGANSPVDLGFLPTLWTLTGPIYILGGLLFARNIPRPHPAAGSCLPLGRAWLRSPDYFPLQHSPRSRSPLASRWRGSATR